MTIKFARLQEYLDLIVAKAEGNIDVAPHRRFWASHQSLTGQPLPSPKCQGQPIFAVKYLDPERTRVDANNSPLFVILTNPDGFCDRAQMPPLGPFITDSDYQITLSDGTVMTGDQIKNDIHDWLASGAPNN